MRRKKEQKGFTIIEVMLFLAISGLMLIGVIGGTYSAIASQRYTDSVRSFAEFLRQTYAEVISPETLGAGNSNTQAVYGKAIIFGLDNYGENDDRVENRIYTATLVGKESSSSNSDFLESLSEQNGGVDLQFYCGAKDGAGTETQPSTVESYLPAWEAKIYNTDKKTFNGTVLIVRSPKSGVVRTVYSDKTFNIKDNCKPDDTSANYAFREALNHRTFRVSDIDFCIKADQSSLQAPMRDVRLAPDGRNTSAVSIIDLDDKADNQEDNKCR